MYRQRLLLANRFLLRHDCSALIMASALSCAMLAARSLLSHSWDYLHLVWNLWLAWIPQLLSMWAATLAQRHHRKPWLLLGPALLWLIFLPNAPYLLTEFVHLLHIPSRVLWLDFAMLLCFAWTGCLLAVASLSTMHRLVEEFVGRGMGWAFVVVVAWLSGLGVYLGRVRRWNSWDLLLNPGAVVADVITLVVHPLAHARTHTVAALVGALLFVSYLMFAGGHAPSAAEQGHARY